MGALRSKMIEEMKLRNFSPRTEQSYVSAMVRLVKYYHQDPKKGHFTFPCQMIFEGAESPHGKNGPGLGWRNLRSTY